MREGTTCVCLIFCRACLTFASFIVVGLMMAVMATSFTLPLNNFISHPVAKLDEL